MLQEPYTAPQVKQSICLLSAPVMPSTASAIVCTKSKNTLYTPQLQYVNAQALSVAVAGVGVVIHGAASYLIDVVLPAAVLAVEVGSHAKAVPQRLLKIAGTHRLVARLNVGR